MTPREGTKIAMVTNPFQRDQGADLGELIAATGWFPHTARAAMTGLRHRGHEVRLERDGFEPSVWASTPSASEALPYFANAPINIPIARSTASPTIGRRSCHDSLCAGPDRLQWGDSCRSGERGEDICPYILHRL